MTEFEISFAEKLLKALNLDEDVEIDSITRDTPLFGDEGLELDSIDAIEIEVMVKQEFGIDILPAERTRSTFGSFGILADFVLTNRERDM